MNEFDIMLGMDFLLEHKVIHMPLAKWLVLTGSNPIIIQKNTRQPKGAKLMSTLQLERDLSHDEPTFAAIVIVEEGSSSELALIETSRSLQKYCDARLESQTKYLSPPRKIDHEINFMLGARLLPQTCVIRLNLS